MKTLEKRLQIALAKGDSSGVRACCSEAFEAYERLAFYVANQILGNDEMAKDAVSETFLSFMSNLDSMEIKSIKYYLVQSSKRIATRMLYKESRSAEYDEEVLAGPPQTENAYAKSDAEKALLILDEEEREIVLLKIEYGYKFKEIGEKLGITENAASSKYTRSIKKMRNCLEGKG